MHQSIINTIIEIAKWIPVSLFLVAIGVVAWLITEVATKPAKTKPSAKLTYLHCEGYTRTGKGKWRRVA